MDEAPQKFIRAKLHGAETAKFSPVNLSTFTVLAISIPRSHNPIHYSAYGLHYSCVVRPYFMKTLLQSIWPYTEDGVATRVWNYVLYHLPVFKTAVVMCSFNCLIVLEAKCRPSNGSNFIVLS